MTFGVDLSRGVSPSGRQRNGSALPPTTYQVGKPSSSEGIPTNVTLCFSQSGPGAYRHQPSAALRIWRERSAFCKLGHLEERVLGASIEANFIVGSQVRLHRVTHACPQAYFGMILARISGGIQILNRIRLWAVVAHGKRGGGSCSLSLAWPW